LGKRIALLAVLLGLSLALWGQSAAPGLGERIQDYINGTGIPAWAKVFCIAMLPIFELRGAIPWGMGMERASLSLWQVFALAVAGNMAPLFFLLPILRLAERLMSRSAALRRALDWLFTRTRNRSAIIEKYEELGLIIFVAIPLPVTGGWTGAVAAYLLGLSYWKSMLCLFAGVCIAGVVVTFLSSVLFHVGLIGLIVLLAGIAMWILYRAFKGGRNGSVRQE